MVREALIIEDKTIVVIIAATYRGGVFSTYYN